MTRAPATVVVPTLGRATLHACLESLARCDPAPAETIVVDQRPQEAAATPLTPPVELEHQIITAGPGTVGRGLNIGLEAARHERVLVTHDDCTVASSWVGVAVRSANAYPGAVITGRVKAAGNPERVPTLRDEAGTWTYAGRARCDLLPGCNLVLDRDAVVAVGGFDARVGTAEDNDFCYRWTRSGRVIRYESDLTIWHHAWRTPAELEEVYVRYAHDLGMVYGKHLRQGDPRVLRFLAADLHASARGFGARLSGRRARWQDWRQGIPRGLANGLLDGWRAYGNEAG